MSKYISNRQQNLKIGIVSYTENKTVLEVTGKVGIGTTNATSKLHVIGDVIVTGIITATTFVGALTGTASSTTNIPNLTGDITSINKATTLATVNSNVGTFGSGGAIPSITVNAKGLITGVTTTAVNPANDGTLTLAVSGTGLSGSASFTANQSGASSFTVTSNATNANTASAIVARDGSGNFSAGTITASLTGTASSTTNIPNLTGAITSVNTTTSLGSFTSTQLATALTDETGSGSAVFATSPTLVTPVLGAATATSIVVGSGVTINASGINASGIITASTFVGTLTGTATSTTNIPNLTGDITSVNKATTLATVNSNVGTFGSGGAIPSITVNAKGLITGITTFALAASGGGLTLSDDTSTNASRFLTFTSATSGSISTANVSSTKLTFNPSTGSLSATNFNSTSDINLKENIKPIEDSLNKIIKLNGVTFNWKENQKPSIGVIAQELQEILPELVTQGDVKSVNYNGLIGVLIEAVKEQQKQIEELKDLVKNLTSTQ